MAIEYTWKINSVWKEQKGSTEPTEDTESFDVDLQNFIQSVNITITGTENGISSDFEVCAHLFHDPNSSYTAFEDVTTEKLIEWSKAALTQGVIDNIEAQLKREIEEAANSKLVAWSN